MNSLNNNILYEKDLIVSSKNVDWPNLKNKVILLSGATGLVGRYLIDLLMYQNIHNNLNCKIIGLGRDSKKLKRIFKVYWNNPNFSYIAKDVSNLKKIKARKIDYVIHSASNTSPTQYATDPVGTINTNVFGTINLLNIARMYNAKFLLVSTFEVYGKTENLNEIRENDFGNIDCTILRNCYPESKRLSESICIAYAEQYGVFTTIARLARVFGPTMSEASTLATASFIKNALNNENIVLKSDGEQLYSYNYVGDVASAILTILIKGDIKEAYNVSDKKYDSKLKEIATMVANTVNKKIVFDIPDKVEKSGFSNLTMTIINSDKLRSLGWKVDKNKK